MTIDISENNREEFSPEMVYAGSETFHESRKSETPDEELSGLLKRLEVVKGEMNEEKDEREEYIGKKVVVRLFEEQWFRCQMIYKEKDDEIEYLVKKQKQDLHNLQDILEEQERSEV